MNEKELGILETLKNIILDKVGIDLDDLHTENQEIVKLNLKNDIGLDSLDELELVMECEKQFDITITDAEAEQCFIINDLIVYINKKI